MSMINNALSGSQAAQAALSAASQNIANVMTAGYSRQGVLLASRTVSGNGASSGAGVAVTSLVRFNDDFKNLQLWSAASKLGQANAPQAYLDQLEQVMSDDTSNINKGLDVFFAALNAASVQPDSMPLREQVLTAADGLAKRFASLQTLLQNQRDAVAQQRDSVVLQINTLSADIALLNQKIASAQAVGVPPAELQDSRDQRIDQLAALVGIQVTRQDDGSCHVSLKSGQPLVMGGESADLQVQRNNDGSHTLKLDFASTSFTVLGDDFGGQLGGLENFERQNLVTTQQTLRELATGIATSFNAQLAAGCAPPAALGTGKPLFADPAGNGGQLQVTSLQASELAFSLDPNAAGDSRNLAELVKLKDRKLSFTLFDSLGRAQPVPGQVVMADAYTQLVGKMGVASQQNIAAQKTAQTVRDQADASWKSTSGVNTDEEATNLMQYQQMYQANMKVIAVANQLFDATLAMI